MQHPDALIAFLKETSFAPVISALKDTLPAWLDLSSANPRLTPEVFTSATTFQQFIDQELERQKAGYGIGGYLEDRMIYRRSEHFGSVGEEPRSIHLGIDLWQAAGTPIFAPSKAKIHSLKDNAGWGNYGPTLILEHETSAGNYFTLYGHLNRESLSKWRPNQPIAEGQLLAHFGAEAENGNWPPHLHFQLMTDMQGWEGDFPGVCKPSEKEEYRAVCLDPNLILEVKE